MNLDKELFKKKKKKVKIFFQASQELAKILDDFAEKTGLSRSEIIRQCIEKSFNIRTFTGIDMK